MIRCPYAPRSRIFHEIRLSYSGPQSSKPRPVSSGSYYRSHRSGSERPISGSTAQLFQSLTIHHKAAITTNRHHLAVWINHGGEHCSGSPAHCSQGIVQENSVWLECRVISCKPDFVNTIIKGDDIVITIRFRISDTISCGRRNVGSSASRKISLLRCPDFLKITKIYIKFSDRGPRPMRQRIGRCHRRPHLWKINLIHLG